MSKRRASELRIGDRYVVSARRWNRVTGDFCDTPEIIREIISIGVSYVDRYGDRYVPLSIADRHGLVVVDVLAETEYEVIDP